MLFKSFRGSLLEWVWEMVGQMFPIFFKSQMSYFLPTNKQPLRVVLGCKVRSCLHDIAFDFLVSMSKIQQECESQSAAAPALYWTCCEWYSERSESHGGQVSQPQSSRPHSEWQRSAGRSWRLIFSKYWDILGHIVTIIITLFFILQINK